MSTRLCQVFLGNRIDDRNELRFLQRVCSDLERRRCAARIYANLITRRSQRQVDFLISTAHQLVHVELKTVDPELPLVGSANGSWKQQLPDGQHRSLERNYYRQAQSTTFAISDDIHDLARSGDVPRSEGKFYADIHTVICMFPDIPAGSRLEPYRYVDVVGYQQLLQLLCNDGPHRSETTSTGRRSSVIYSCFPSRLTATTRRSSGSAEPWWRTIAAGS